MYKHINAKTVYSKNIFVHVVFLFSHRHVPNEKKLLMFKF